MSTRSTFPGSGQRLDGGRTMTQQMQPNSSVQGNTDSGSRGTGNRRFATLDDLNTNSPDGLNASFPVVPSPVEDDANDGANHAADDDQRGGDNVEVVKQYGNISLGDNHRVGRNVFDFGDGAEEESTETAADEAEATENPEPTDKATDIPPNNKNRVNMKVGTLFGSTYIGNNHRKAGDLYKFGHK